MWPVGVRFQVGGVLRAESEAIVSFGLSRRLHPVLGSVLSTWKEALWEFIRYRQAPVTLLSQSQSMAGVKDSLPLPHSLDLPPA